MKNIRLIRPADRWFPEAWSLYEEAFPEGERRSMEGQHRVMKKQAYHCEAVTDDDAFMGILFWWEFDDLRYLEHLATWPDLRGRGYGQRILEGFLHRDGRKIILDVEQPEDAMKRRRIRFYERSGFILNSHDYMQPPMREGSGPVPLLLMSYPVPLSGTALSDFITGCHPVIYG